jgi:hypothetical protein
MLAKCRPMKLYRINISHEAIEADAFKHMKATMATTNARSLT